MTGVIERLGVLGVFLLDGVARPGRVASNVRA